MTPRPWRCPAACDAGGRTARKVPAGVAWPHTAPAIAVLAVLLTLGSGTLPRWAGAMGVRSGSGPAGQPPAQADHVPGEVIVQFQDGVSPAARDALLERLGMRVKRSLGGQNAYVVTIVDGSSVAEAIARLKAQPEVRRAEPNRIARLHPVRPPPGAPGPR